MENRYIFTHEFQLKKGDIHSVGCHGENLISYCSNVNTINTNNMILKEGSAQQSAELFGVTKLNVYLVQATFDLFFVRLLHITVD